MFYKERIALAYEILSGIPEDNILLSAYVTEGDGTPTCGTIACGAGWLAMHPAFQAMGLRLEASRHGLLSPNGLLFPSLGEDYGSKSLSFIFGDTDTFYKLFASRGRGLWDEKLLQEMGCISDKELLLARLRYAYHNDVFTAESATA